MSQSHVIIEVSDAWLLDSELPAVRRRGVIYAPSDTALATQEVAVVASPPVSSEPATTLLPALRLPQRHIAAEAMPLLPRTMSAADDLPTVVTPVLRLVDEDIATVMLPITTPAVAISMTPTRPRPEPLHFCHQCGAALPPWRESCFTHEARFGRGLPPPLTLAALPDSAVDLRPTLPLPAIKRRRRAG